MYTSVTPSVNVALVGQGGGTKVGHGLQSGKHLRPYQQNSLLGGKKEGRTNPPYIWPHALMPSQQTETVVEHLLVVGLVEVEVHGGSVLTEVITVVGLVEAEVSGGSVLTEVTTVVGLVGLVRV